jgi:hypothetical protein
MEPVKPLASAADGMPCFFELTTVVLNFFTRQNRDGMDEPQFLIVGQLAICKNGSLTWRHLLPGLIQVGKSV